MTVDDFYDQEMNKKPAVESCFANTIGITYCSGEIQQEQIHAVDEMKAFAKAYYEAEMKDLRWLVERGATHEELIERINYDIPI